MSTAASPPAGGASPPLQGSPGGVITVVNSTVREVDAVEQTLQALASALAHGGGAQAATLRHLELFEAAVQGLKESAGEAAARRDELLVAAKRLALELRGLDLLAGHVQSVSELVRKLEAQAAEVIRSAGSGGAR
ncbi:acetoin reductase [Chlorella sorokiniana]|uniref:Acetoin reductase n=1 Tax=Chlorella sorokiniana TaxID=3076 RepID=A0A2P6U0N1_CHLSO|nr:acetoin reductase [Chlorella sorokiniana]|eukprot:PRW59848.1 acetoin reductase [Chlorella sorokiniana]